VRKITDKVFDRLTEDAQKREKEALTLEEVYIAVLCVYKYSSRSNHRGPLRLQVLCSFSPFLIGFVLVGQ